MSDTELPPSSMETGTQDASQKEEGSRDVENASHEEREDVEMKDVIDWVESEVDENELFREAREEKIIESGSMVRSVEKRLTEDEDEAETGRSVSGTEKEIEGGQSEIASSSAHLIITSIIESILNIVSIQIKEKEERTEEEERKEKEHETDGGKLHKAKSAESIQTISVTTIKSVGSISSDGSDERRLNRLAEEAEMRKEKEERKRQDKFDENVRLFNEGVKRRTELKRRNAYLARKMYEHYRLQKIEHLFKEAHSGYQDMEARFIRSLFRYGELKHSADIEDGRVNALIELLTARHQQISDVMREELGNFAAREREIGQSLCYNNTTKTMPDKLVNQLIQNQLAKVAQVDQHRVNYFILRDRTNTEEAQLKALEDIGEGCTMKEYDQLRLQNQGCTEKLEERETELERLRGKALAAMQIRTEVREAAFATAEDIEAEKIILKDVERDLAETRERLGSEKKRRDMNRFDTQRLKREAGLISEPTLLRDYKRSENERRALTDEVARLRLKFASQQDLMSLMRKTISKASTVVSDV